MKKLAVLFFLLGLCSSFSQDTLRQQITFVSGADCKNFSTPQFYNDGGYFVFEADFGSKTNIFLGKYDITENSFNIIKNVTDNNFRNINPSLINTYSDTLILLYQTNENGNEDIAYKYIVNEAASETNFLTTSPGDEVNPQFMKFVYVADTNGYIIYQSKSSDRIGVTVQRMFTSDPAVVVFNPSADNYYTSPSMTELPNKITVIASVDSSDGNHYIVSRSLSNHSWGDKQLFMQVDAGHTNFNIFNSIGMEITFDAIDTSTGNRNIYFSNPDNSASVEKFFEHPDYDISEFHTGFELILVGDYLPRQPYCFKASRNDSTFIAVSKNIIPKDFSEDTLLYTKVNTSSLDVAKVGMEFKGSEIYYMVWQDSVDDHIQLFGRKNLNPISSVESTGSISNNFTLNQNYPNPFNPSTTINYSLLKNGHIKLSIYSIIGEVVAVPVNEYQTAGDHKVSFNAKNLSSGVYFYELSSDGNRSVKKMIFMK